MSKSRPDGSAVAPRSSRRMRMVALVVVAALTAAACTGGTGDAGTDGTSSPSSSELATGGALARAAFKTGIGTQDFRVVFDLARIDSTGEVTSFFGEVLEQAERGATDQSVVDDDLTVRATTGIEGQVVDLQGEVVDAISVDVGIVDLSASSLRELQAEASQEYQSAIETVGVPASGDGVALVILSTVDLDQHLTNVDVGDQIELDLTFVDGIEVGDTFRRVSYFGQTLPPADPEAERGLTPFEVFASRWSAGSVAILGSGDVANPGAMALVDDSGVVVAGSKKARADLKLSNAEIDAFTGSAGLFATCLAVVVVGGDPRLKAGAAACLLIALLWNKRAANVKAQLAEEQNDPEDPPDDNNDDACVVAPPPTLAPQRQQPLDAPDETPSGGGGGNVPGGNVPISFRSISFRSAGNCDQPGPAATGDVHVRTWDGGRYNAQFVGEFVAAASSAGHEVQLRMTAYNDSVSVNDAAAVRVGSAVVAVTPGENGTPVATVDGRILETTRGESVTVDVGELVASGRSIHVIWPDGVSLKASQSGDHLDVRMVGNTDPAVTWEGLFGSPDGDRENDIMIRGGRELGDDHAFADVHGPFADSWRVEDANSLLPYGAGESTATFTDRGFPREQQMMSDLSADQVAAAERDCLAFGIVEPQTLIDCTFDLAVSGDRSFLRSAGMMQTVIGRATPAAGGTGTTPTGMVWVDTVPAPAVSVEPIGGSVVADDEIVLARAWTRNQSTMLGAWTTTDGTLRWSVDGVSPTCQPLLTPVGVVVQLDPSVPTNVSGRADLVLLDRGDGSEQARWSISTSDRFAECARPMVLNDDGSAMVHVGDDNIVRSFTIDASEISFNWATPITSSQHVVRVEVRSNAVIAVGRDPKCCVVLTTLDLDTGDAAGTLDLGPGDIDPSDTNAVAALPSGLLAVLVRANRDGVSRLVVLDTAGGLRVRWEQPLSGPNAEIVGDIVQVAGNGEVVAGWTRMADGRAGVAAFGMGTGDLEWFYEPSSFDNSFGAIEATPSRGFVVIPFGGAWLEAITSTGQRDWTLAGVDPYEQPFTIGPATASGLVVTGALLDPEGEYTTYVGVVPLN